MPLCCNHCAKRHEECIVPVSGTACTRCKDRKVKCSLALGRKQGNEYVEDDDTEEETETERPKKKAKLVPVRPRAGPVSVEVPQPGSSSLARIAMALEATNRLLLRSMVAAEDAARALSQIVRVQAMMAEDTRRLAGWHESGLGLGLGLGLVQSGWVTQRGADWCQLGVDGDGNGSVDREGENDGEQMVEETLKE